MGDAAKVDIIIDAKVQALASLSTLRDMIEEREKCILVLKEDLDKVRLKNSCWWDAKPCLNYSQTGGFQEAGTLCQGCFRVDPKRFASLLEEIVPDFLRAFADDVTKDEKEDLMEDAWEEVHKKILEIVVEFKDED